MSILKVILLFPFALSGCAFIQKQQSNSTKMLVPKVVWVRSTLKQPHEKYLKIQRAQSLVYKNNVIQASSLDGISSFDKNNGQLKWSFIVTEGVEGSLLNIDDTLYFGGNNGMIYSLNADKGTLNWSFQTRNEIFSQLNFDEETQSIFVLTGGNVLYSLDALSGKINWSFVRQDTTAFTIRGGSQPVIYKEKILVGFSEGSIIAFNKKNGNLVWEKTLNKNKKFKDIDSSVVVDEDRIYFSGYEDHIYCLDVNSGDLVWKLKAGGYANIRISNNFLYFPTSDGRLLTLKKESGEKIWEYKTDNGILTEVEFLKNMVLFGESQGGLVFLDQTTGKKLASYFPGKGLLAKPTVDMSINRVFFISGEANLFSVNPEWIDKSLLLF